MSAERASKLKTRGFAIASLLVAGGAITFLAAGGLGKNLVYYWGPSELREAGSRAQGATIRLGGQVVPGSIKFQEAASKLDFAVTDGKAQVAVRSHGVPPQMFRENIGVVVEGTLGADGAFESTRLMVSHGNEYRAPKQGEKADAKALMKSVRETSGEEGGAR